MKIKFLHLILVVIMATSAVLSACAPSPVAVPSQVSSIVPGIDLKKDLADFGQWYTNKKNEQANLQILIGNRVRVGSLYFSTLNALVANNTNCFVNVKNAESAVARATFDPGQDKGTLINALVSNTLNAEQATTVCAQGNQKIADYVIDGRKAIYDADMQMYEAAVNFQNGLSNEIVGKIRYDFLTTFADPTEAERQMRLAGIPGLTDITMPPDEGLFYDMPGNSDICTYYNSGAFENDLPRPVKDMFYGHEDSLRRRYSAQWTPPLGGSQGNCRLFASAALKQVTTPILSTIMVTQINTGVDNGNEIPTVVPNP